MVYLHDKRENGLGLEKPTNTALSTLICPAQTCIASSCGVSTGTRFIQSG